MSTDPIPRHTYEMTEGTPPTEFGVHEPRTMKHTATHGDDTDLFMMTEVGDGTFVQWSSCRSCNKKVALCTCPGGPVTPHYMEPWKANRFAREVNARPDLDYAAIPRVITWLRERGYTVTKKGEKPEKAEESTSETVAPTAAVTAGIDAAIEAVKSEAQPKRLEEFDVDF